VIDRYNYTRSFEQIMSTSPFTFDDVLNEDVFAHVLATPTMPNELYESDTFTTVNQTPPSSAPRYARANKPRAPRTPHAGETKQDGVTIRSKFKSYRSCSRSNIHKPKRIDFNLMVDKAVDTHDLVQTCASREPIGTKECILENFDFDDLDNVITMIDLIETTAQDNLLCVETLDGIGDAPRADRKPKTICSIQLQPMKLYAHDFKRVNAMLAGVPA
jgi:hypothetical protein